MCLKDDDASYITVEEAEPFIRHIMQCCGLVETLARICTEEGRIDIKVMGAQLGFKMTYTTRIDVEQLISLVCILIKHMFEIQKNDAEKWRKDISELMKEQSKTYNNALTTFNKRYIEMIKTHHAEVDEAYKIEEEFAAQWNEHVDLQNTIRNQQEAVVTSMNELAGRNLEERKRARREKFLESVQVMCKKKRVDSKGISTFSFTYPSYLTPAGAPISAGGGNIYVNKRPGA